MATAATNKPNTITLSTLQTKQETRSPTIKPVTDAFTNRLTINDTEGDGWYSSRTNPARRPLAYNSGSQETKRKLTQYYDEIRNTKKSTQKELVQLLNKERKNIEDAINTAVASLHRESFAISKNFITSQKTTADKIANATKKHTSGTKSSHQAIYEREWNSAQRKIVNRLNRKVQNAIDTVHSRMDTLIPPHKSDTIELFLNNYKESDAIPTKLLKHAEPSKNKNNSLGVLDHKIDAAILNFRTAVEASNTLLSENCAQSGDTEEKITSFTSPYNLANHTINSPKATVALRIKSMHNVLTKTIEDIQKVVPSRKLTALKQQLDSTSAKLVQDIGNSAYNFYTSLDDSVYLSDCTKELVKKYKQPENPLLALAKKNKRLLNLDVKSIKEKFKENLAELFNDANRWKPYSNTITLPEGSKKYEIKLQVTPIGQLTQILENGDDVDLAPSLRTIPTDPTISKGISSISQTNQQHMTNTWATQMSISRRDLTPSSNTPDEAPSTFKGIRSGILTTKIKGDDRKSKEDASIQKTKELIASMIKLRKPEELEKALTNAMNGQTSEPINITILSTSLLTPARWFGNERALFFNDQLATLQKFPYKTNEESLQTTTTRIPFTIRTNTDDRTHVVEVDVHCQIIPSNFGVNLGATELPSVIKPLTNKVVGWDNKLHRVNEEAMRAFFGNTLIDQDSTLKKVQSTFQKFLAKNEKPGNNTMRFELKKFLENHLGGLVQEKLADKKTSESDKSIIMQLSAYIIDMWKNKKHMSGNDYSYKMPAYMQALAHFLDIGSWWNCKSGKDRTSVLNDEINALLVKILTENKVPNPDYRPSIKDQSVRRQFINGNHHIQTCASGLAGYKTKGVKAIYNRLGPSKETAKLHELISGAVKS